MAFTTNTSRKKRYRSGSFSSTQGTNVVKRGLLNVPDIPFKELHSFPFVSYVSIEDRISVGCLPRSNYVEISKLIEPFKCMKLSDMLIRFYGWKTIFNVVFRAAGSDSERIAHVCKSHAFVTSERALVKVKSLQPGTLVQSDVAGRLLEVVSVDRGQYCPVVEIGTLSPNATYSVSGALSANLHSHRKFLTITSFGIMAFRDDGPEPRVLMVMGRYSYPFCDILRGRYYNQPADEMARVFVSEMSAAERTLLRTRSFQSLWQMLDLPVAESDQQVFANNSSSSDEEWPPPVGRKPSAFAKAKRKFEQLDLDRLCSETPVSYHHPEVGLPKGRMAQKESALTTAIRETKEETGLGEEEYEVLDPDDPIVEVFVGSNGVRYKSQYFLARLTNFDVADDVAPQKDREIASSMWLTKDKALAMLRDYDDAKRSVIHEGFRRFERYQQRRRQSSDGAPTDGESSVRSASGIGPILARRSSE